MDRLVDGSRGLTQRTRHHGGFLRRYRRQLYTVASVVGGLIIWEIAASNTSRLVMATLQSIWQAFRESVSAGTLGGDVASTFEAFGIGIAISIVLGIAMGLLMASSEAVFALLDPWVSALRSTPLICIAPLVIVEFGISLQARVVVVVLLAVFPIILNTADGIKTTDRSFVELAYSFGAGRAQVFRKILLPSAVPFILSGIRLALNMGLVGEVVAEFFGSSQGVGFMVFQSSQQFDTGSVYLGVFILALTGVLMTKAMYLLERRIAPWREFDLRARKG